MLSNTDAQQTFPLFNGIKTTSKFQRLPGEIVRQTSHFESVTNGATDTNKELNILAAPAACEIRAPSNLA